LLRRTVGDLRRAVLALFAQLLAHTAEIAGGAADLLTGLPGPLIDLLLEGFPGLAGCLARLVLCLAGAALDLVLLGGVLFYVAWARWARRRDAVAHKSSLGDRLAPRHRRGHFPGSARTKSKRRDIG